MATWRQSVSADRLPRGVAEQGRGLGQPARRAPACPARRAPGGRRVPVSSAICSTSVGSQSSRLVAVARVGRGLGAPCRRAPRCTRRDWGPRGPSSSPAAPRSAAAWTPPRRGPAPAPARRGARTCGAGGAGGARSSGPLVAAAASTTSTTASTASTSDGGEREALPLGVVGPGLEHPAERLRLERGDQPGHPLAHPRLPGPRASATSRRPSGRDSRAPRGHTPPARLRVDRARHQQRILLVRSPKRRRTPAPGARGRATARRAGDLADAAASSSFCSRSRVNSGGWIVRCGHTVRRSGRRPSGPSSPWGSAAQLAEQLVDLTQADPRSNRRVATRWRWSRRARSLSRAFRGSVATPAMMSWWRATPMASEAPRTRAAIPAGRRTARRIPAGEGGPRDTWRACEARSRTRRDSRPGPGRASRRCVRLVWGWGTRYSRLRS